MLARCDSLTGVASGAAASFLPLTASAEAGARSGAHGRKIALSGADAGTFSPNDICGPDDACLMAVGPDGRFQPVSPLTA